MCFEAILKLNHALLNCGVTQNVTDSLVTGIGRSLSTNDCDVLHEAEDNYEKCKKGLEEC